MKIWTHGLRGQIEFVPIYIRLQRSSGDVDDVEIRLFNRSDTQTYAYQMRLVINPADLLKNIGDSYPALYMYLLATSIELNRDRTNFSFYRDALIEIYKDEKIFTSVLDEFQATPTELNIKDRVRITGNDKEMLALYESITKAESDERVFSLPDFLEHYSN